MTSTTGLTGPMQLFYDRTFLDRAEAELRYDWGAQKRSIPMNSGKSIVFNRFSTLAAQTTPLTEGTTPTSIDMTSTVVSATILEYGAYVTVSTLFNMTSLDEGLKEHVEVLGYNAGFTVDTLIKEVMKAGGTAQLAGAKSDITAVAATDTLSSTEIKKAVRTLKKAFARTFSNGMFRGIVPVSGVYDLRGDSTWLSAQIYTDSSKVKNGSIGALHGVDFVETNNEATTSSTVTVYHTFIFGQNAYGTINLAGQPEKHIYLKNPGMNDTSNPLDMYSTVGWKVQFIAKMINDNWMINLKHGVTA